jgi:hypothetical protein
MQDPRSSEPALDNGSHALGLEVYRGHEQRMARLYIPCKALEIDIAETPINYRHEYRAGLSNDKRCDQSGSNAAPELKGELPQYA